MAYSSGVFSRLYNWISDRDGAIKIRADRMDAEFDGIAAGLSLVICRDGQSTVSANIPFNNKKITGLGDATAVTDALNQQSGDARFLKRPSTLGAISDIADGDIFGIYDLSAVGDAGITYANLKADILIEGTAAGSSFFPVGTALLAYQAAAPTGWTKSVVNTDKALRVVSDATGGSAGGTTAFSTVMASRTPAGTVGGSSLTEAQLAVHFHNLALNRTVNTSATGAVQDNVNTGNTNTASAGSGATHTHSFTGTAMDFAVQYINVIVITKN